MDKQKIKKIQLGVRIAIFLIFLLGVFVKIPIILLYLLPVLIIANLSIGFVTKKKSIAMNVVLLAIYPLLHIILIEYIAIIIGTILSFIHALLYFLDYRKNK